MARNVRHSGKPSGSDSIEVSSTFQASTTHAPELRKGVTEGKTSGKIKPNGIEVGPVGGATFTVNKPAVDFPSRPAPMRGSKVVKSSESNGFAPSDTVSRTATGYTGQKSYGLKSSYEKR